MPSKLVTTFIELTGNPKDHAHRWRPDLRSAPNVYRGTSTSRCMKLCGRNNDGGPHFTSERQDEGTDLTKFRPW